ncbi:conserved Plasmodium protein, unknown function [Plasmodium knowlesi strain H]|uniref:Protein CINCH n=3 Tax=Plasmodium knowlesi TaxID=5850 RepID=A0A5K1V682_PLAKH|nr:protein CINCH, putative [Plasmodium knowlesi strain H]OTN68448.1 Uncharacterized protein PKNOH_S02298100 [Plasmodium knowlesi]CAA9986486.1 protein CINCH, putative [Plasmodium knowlesi strain H]SBO24258.1 conserved Plasmodium protein, unknown function [Plasmodium knowlesi strain H]SBO29733.1 conserved Plasmodium protein, unknown function [Plasmodium knowlesi strain H]VVS75960.1 protein CINCH, putative [Plasmodium knowlesi strain H]|eukprot:XP_002261037.1 hypothetical protein, conserved in Plasmodium species [Plasmodium knowlesi strain H]
MGTTNNLNEVHSASGVGYMNKYDVEKYGTAHNMERSKRENLPINSPNMEVFHSLNYENDIYMNPQQGGDIPTGELTVKNSPNDNQTDRPTDRPNDNQTDRRTDHHADTRTDTSNVDALFSGNKYKVKKIKDTHSISADYKQKKNLTSILPFEKIMEEYKIKNLYPENKVQELYNHKNVYEEKGGYNWIPLNGHFTNGTMRKDLSVDSSDGSSPYLSKGSTLMYGGQYTYGTSVNSSSFGGANEAKERHISSASSGKLSQMGYAARGMDSISNRVNQGSPLQVESNQQVQMNQTGTGHPGVKTIQTEIPNTNAEEKEKRGVPPFNDLEQNDQYNQNNLLEMYDHKQNKKVIYYAVKNHYDPSKEMHKKEKEREREKGNYPPHKNKVYQNDIYDYLLHHYEKNYKNFFDNRYMDQSVFKGEPKEFLASQANTSHWNSADGSKGRDTNGTYITEGVLKTKDYNNDGDVDNSKRENRNVTPRSIEEGNQGNLAEGLMSDKLKGTHLCHKNSDSLNVNNAKDVKAMEDVIPLNGREENTYQNSVEISNLCDEDAMDLYKNIGEVYTSRPKLFVYAGKGEKRHMEKSNIGEVHRVDTPLDDFPLQINKEMKKIFNRMKNKNTVVISNVGVKAGSSTFSNHILNSGQERGFFGGGADQKNCVYAHVMASPNKINYVYLDYDKLLLRGGRSMSGDRMKRDDRIKRDHSRSVGRISSGEGNPPNEANALIALSFYLSNIIIFHINRESCSKAFALLAHYYDVVRHIREHLKRRREKCPKQDPAMDTATNVGWVSRSGSKLDGKSGKSEQRSDGNLEEDNLGEDNFSVPYFVFVLRDTTLGRESGKNVHEEDGPKMHKEDGANKLPLRKSLTREAESKRITPKVERNSLPKVERNSSPKAERNSPPKLPPTGDGQSARAQLLLEELIDGEKNRVVQKKVKYLLKFLAKKSLFHLPPPKEKYKQEYAIQLRKIKKEIFINGKNVENIYPNNGIYVYKYLNMLTYTINKNIFYTPNYLKKKMESCECKTLHKVLTDNFLLHVRRKIENKLPMKPNLFLTLINDIKIEFLLSFETLCIGNSRLKRKYKNKLCHNIDVIILKAYKENIAFSCFTFFNIIDKKINKLQIYSKIDKRKYEHFDELKNDIENINDGSIDNLIYNEILGIKKEEIWTYFIKSYYSGFSSRKGSSLVKVQEEKEGEKQHMYHTNSRGHSKGMKKSGYNSDSTVDPDQFADPFNHQRSRRSASGVRVSRMHTSASSTLLRRGSRHHSEKAFSKGGSCSSGGKESPNYGPEKHPKGNIYKSTEHSLRGKDSSHERSDRSHLEKRDVKDATNGRQRKPSRKTLHQCKSDLALQDERKIKMVQEFQLEDRNISKKYHSVDYRNALPGHVHKNEGSESNSEDPYNHGEAAFQHAGVQTWPNTTEQIQKQEKQRQKRR